MASNVFAQVSEAGRRKDWPARWQNYFLSRMITAFQAQLTWYPWESCEPTLLGVKEVIHLRIIQQRENSWLAARDARGAPFSQKKTSTA
jgi:hypothetical protein